MTELDWAQAEVDGLCRELSDAIARAEKSGRLRATIATSFSNSGAPQTVRVEVRKRPDFELELRGIAP